MKDIKEIGITKEYYDSEDTIGWTTIWIYFETGVSQIKDFDEAEHLGEYELAILQDVIYS